MKAITKSIVLKMLTGATTTALTVAGVATGAVRMPAFVAQKEAVAVAEVEAVADEQVNAIVDKVVGNDAAVVESDGGAAPVEVSVDEDAPVPVYQKELEEAESKNTDTVISTTNTTGTTASTGTTTNTVDKTDAEKKAAKEAEAKKAAEETAAKKAAEEAAAKKATEEAAAKKAAEEAKVEVAAAETEETEDDEENQVYTAQSEYIITIEFLPEEESAVVEEPAPMPEPIYVEVTRYNCNCGYTTYDYNELKQHMLQHALNGDRNSYSAHVEKVQQ